MPTSKAKGRQFSLTLSSREKKVLEDLAEDEGRSQANFVRKLINDAWEEREKKKSRHGRA